MVAVKAAPKTMPGSGEVAWWTSTASTLFPGTSLETGRSMPESNGALPTAVEAGVA